MKLSDLKTKEEFYDFADCWYQRTHNLMSYHKNENNPIDKRDKAYNLWFEMAGRIMVLFEITKKINQVQPRFKKGSN